MGYLVETSGRIRLPQELERQALTVLEVRMGARQGWFDADDVHVDTLAELAPYAAAQVRREGDWLVVGTDEDGDPKWSEQASEFYRVLGSFVHEGEVHVRGEDGEAWSYHYSPEGVEQRGDNGWDGSPGDSTGATPEVTPAAPPTAPEPPTAGPPAQDLPSPPGSAQGAPDPSQFRYPGREDPPPEPPRSEQPPPAPAPYADEPPVAPHSPGPGLDQPGWAPDPRAERAWADPPPASPGRTALMTLLLVVGVILIIGLALVVSGL